MKFRGKIFTSIALMLLLLTGFYDSLNAQVQQGTSSFLPTRIEKDFDIHTKLDNPQWKLAAPLFIKYQTIPDPDAKAPVETEVKVLYSTHNLYVAFIASDPNPKKIRAQLAERDEVSADDYVGVLMDTYGSNKDAFELLVNPLGVQMDLYRSGDDENASFDAVWYSEGRITDSGYVAVMKIPFKSLNFPQGELQDWRIQFVRNYPRNARYQMSWTKITIGNPCLLCQSGTLKSLSNIKGGGTIELLPYLLASQTSTIKDPANLNSGLDPASIQMRAGGSISYDITSNTSVNVVINPDFSQIETDAAEISINQAFAIFYPEKRPFFVRGADLFKSSENLYYSRTINNPLAAAKFTHQTDKFSLGLMTAYDKNSPFVIPGQYESDLVSSSVNSYVNVLRGKYNFGPETFIAGLITTRNYMSGANYVGSLDGQVKLIKHYYLNGQLGYSNTKEINDTLLFNDQRKFGKAEYDAALNGEKYEGAMMSIGFERQAKHYQFEFGYQTKSPTFQTQTGFVNKTNTKGISLEQSYSYYPAKKWLSQGRLFAFGNWNYDYYGRLMERFLMTGLSNQFAGQTSVEISYMFVNDERFQENFFEGVHRWMIEVESKPIESLDFGVDVDFGQYIYRTSHPVIGKGHNIEAFLTVKPTTHLQLNFTYNYSALSSLDGNLHFFKGNIMRLTGNYHFSRKLSVRLISQYNSFDDQLQIYPLVHYKLNPFTKFYLGMTDYLDQMPNSNGFKDYRETNRQFFAKAQYLIQW